MSENDRYREAYSRVRWLEQMETDFNRPAKLNEQGNLEWFGRAFAYPDQHDTEIGQLIVITDGDRAHDGSVALLGRVTEVLPEIHNSGKSTWDNWIYVRAEQVDWMPVVKGSTERTVFE